MRGRGFSSRGGGRNGGGRGGHRDGGGRDSGGGRGGRGRGGRGRSGGRRPSFHRGQSAESGNKRERIAVESGFLVLIDQFMLANPQFLDHLAKISDDDAGGKDRLIGEYGGAVVEVQPGTYRIERDPFAASIVIHPSDDEVRSSDILTDASEKKGGVIVDTRCLAMVDRELLDDRGLLEKYSQLWFDGQEKACRDLLRDNGGAVRYGFNRFGDDLTVSRVPDQDIICLWPTHGVSDDSSAGGEPSGDSEPEDGEVSADSGVVPG